MTKIYLIRHCQALGNAMGLFQGSTDCDISELGAKQLEFLSERFKDIHIDSCYSSPLIRAYKTAQAAVKGKDLTVEKKKGLAEIDGGILDGKPFEESFEAMPELKNIWYNRPQDFAPKDGEPMRHAYARIYEAVREIIKENPGKTVAVATHGGVIRCLLCRLKFGTIDKLSSMGWSENTAVTLVEFDDNGGYNIVLENDYSHLPEEYIPVRIRLLKENDE